MRWHTYARRSGTKAVPRPVDTIAYLFGRHQEPWLQTVADAAAGSEHPAARAVRELRADVLAGIAPAQDVPQTDLVAVRCEGQWWHHDPALIDWWAAHLKHELTSRTSGVCLCCGNSARLARTIPAYLPPAVFDTSGSGEMALYPTPRDSSSARRRRAPPETALMCVDCASAIGAALPALAADPQHRHRLPDGTLLLTWNPDGTPPAPLGQLLESPDQQLLDAAPRHGRLCAMLLQPRGRGRIGMTRYWDEPADTILDRLDSWYERFTTINPWTGETRTEPISSLHTQTGRWDPQHHRYTFTRGRPPVPEVDLWIAALDGTTPYGHALAAQAAATRDGRTPGARVALIEQTAMPPR